MELYVLQIIWYLVVCVSVVFYVALDGFDLGVGCLHLFTKTDNERRILLNAIGPFWDGNEVWLIIVGGALFAGFPLVYSTIFSAFYTPSMILLAGIIFRAVAIEFRSRMESPRWRQCWDIFFSVSSYVIALCIGVILGNLVIGIPLDSDWNFIGTFWGFFTPYALLVGVTSISLTMMHGSIFLLMKTEGDLHDKIRGWVMKTIIFFIICYFFLTAATLIYQPHMYARMKASPEFFGIAILAMLAILNIPRMVKKGNDGWAFISSCCSILLLFSLFGIGLFPTLVRSSLHTEVLSLTAFNSSSALKTLQVIVTVAAIGVPLVLAYGFWIYRIFRGKVKLEHTSY